MISAEAYGFVPAYDHFLFEAGCFLNRVMDAGKAYDKNSIIRALCGELHVRWRTADHVLIDLARAGVLSAGYGTYALANATSEGARGR